MPVLLINGTLNEQTFANAALAAHLHALKTVGRGLDAVLVAHSRKSIVVLNTKAEWKAVLNDKGMRTAVFQHVEVDLEGDPGSVVQLASHIERFISIVAPEDKIYVDLTNGQSLQKAALGAVAYVLGAREQFIIDTFRAGKAPQEAGFLSDGELEIAMVMAADPIVFDSVALAWFTEVRRFRELTSQAALAVERILYPADPVSSQLWKAEMLQAIRMWLAGQKARKGVLLGGAVRHTGLAFEELMKGLHARLGLAQAGPQGHKSLDSIIKEIAVKLPAPFRVEVVDGLAKPLKDLRNASAHSFETANSGTRKARSAIETLLALVDRLDSHFGSASSQPVGQRVVEIEGQAGCRYFFGLDGDDTGYELEELFCADIDVSAMKSFSLKIQTVMKKLAEMAMLPPMRGELVFCTGDDLLFQGYFDRDSLESMLREYRNHTGLTCSIGFGRTLKETYYGLKIAKAKPEKGSLFGAQVV